MADTVFDLASVTKQLTATAVLKLEMQGKLTTTDRISKYLASVPKDKERITIHHLLTHTAGVPDDVGGDYDVAPSDDTVQKILAAPLESVPGDKYSYSNTGYSLLAALVEKISGVSWGEFANKYLFQPAHMRDTGYRLPRWRRNMVAESFLSVRYPSPLDRPGPYWNLIGNGGVLSPVGDLLGPDLEMFEAGVGGELRRTHRFASYRAGNRVLWGILRRSPIGFPQAQLPLLAWSWAADRMISRWIPPCDVFHGLTGVCLATARSAKQLGAAILIDQPALHPSVWQREVLADCTSAGVRPESCERLLSQDADTPGRTGIRAVRPHHCLLHSTAAWRSFQPFPYGHEAVIVRPGIDHRLLAPSRATRREPTFRACYVGRIEAAKGVHYLTRAWQRLMLPAAELVLAGNMLPEMAWLDEKGPLAGIRLAGILGQKELAALYHEADVFVFPSVNEGLPLALLEAMSAGLPAIACRGTAAEDLLTPGSNGLLVPGRDVDALASTLMWCYENRQQLLAMGEAARARIEEEFTLAHYAERLRESCRSAADRRMGESRQ